MSQPRSNVPERIYPICRQFASTFGASYCRISFLPSNSALTAGLRSLPAFQPRNAENGVATISFRSESFFNLGCNGGESVRDESASHVARAEIFSIIDHTCRAARPILRFVLGEENGNAGFPALRGVVDLAFHAPRRFSVLEATALLMMAERVKATLILALSESSSAARSSPWLEKVMQGLDGDLFALPFLEAKKRWIDAFEREYLRHQMTKFSGNISRSARATHISRYTLYALLNKFGLSPQSFKKKKSSTMPDHSTAPAEAHTRSNHHDEEAVAVKQVEQLIHSDDAE